MSKTLKTLDEHNSRSWELHNAFRITNGPTLNGIACPDCGEELYDTNPMMTLTSNPPKKSVNCKSCGYHGYRLA